MNVAVIGCGRIANSAHIPSYMANEKATIKYFCDIDISRAEKAVKEYGCGTAVADYKEVLADPEVVAVSICVPNQMHSVIAMDALRAGKHVLCEKPAARTFEEALEMQKVQHETGMTLNIGVVNRFNTNVNKLKELIEQGELGEIYQVYVSFRNRRSIPGLGGPFTTNAISGGGVMIDWGVHFFDIVMYCCGDPKTKSVSAECFCKLGKNISEYTYTSMWAGPEIPDGTYDVEDAVTGIIRTEGPVISFNGAWAQNIEQNEMYIDFLGTKGGVRLKYGGTFTLCSTKNGMLTTTTFQTQEKKMFQEEIDAFINCIETGKREVSHIDTNIITAQMMDAVYRSAKEHREVTL